MRTVALLALALRLSPLALLPVGAATVIGCAPRAGNETQYWENHKKTSAELSAKYPGFKALLAARQAKATPLWDAATKVANEEEKAKQMKAANEACWDGMPARLEETKYKLESLDSATQKIAALKLPKNKADDRVKALTRAQAAKASVEAALVSAKPASEADASKLLDEQISKLISATGDADRDRKALAGK